MMDRPRNSPQESSDGDVRGTIRLIERASLAADLLDRGAAILDTVARAGYPDQAHLTS